MDVSSRLTVTAGPLAAATVAAFFDGVAEVHLLTPRQRDMLARAATSALGASCEGTEVTLRILAADRALFVSMSPAPPAMPAPEEGIAMTMQDDSLILATSRHAA